MRPVHLARALTVFALAAPIALSPVAANATDPLAPLDTTTVQTGQATPDDQTVDADQTGQDTRYASTKEAEQARADMAQVFGDTELTPGQYKWASDIPTSGATKIVISLTDQMGYVYRGDQLVGITTVSSGKTDHETPTGVFPILGKEKVHHSKNYDNAAMPYMLRLNKYGVALHGGMNPGYPASHGCVRLPMKFAQRLFDITATGSPVIIDA